MISKFGFGLDPGALWAASICLLISIVGEDLALPTPTLVSSHTLPCAPRRNSRLVSLTDIIVESAHSGLSVFHFHGQDRHGGLWLGEMGVWRQIEYPFCPGRAD